MTLSDGSRRTHGRETLKCTSSASPGRALRRAEISFFAFLLGWLALTCPGQRAAGDGNLPGILGPDQSPQSKSGRLRDHRVLDVLAKRHSDDRRRGSVVSALQVR